MVMPFATLGPLLAVFGLAVGSFLNVVIYRVPAKLSVVQPPSRCPSCETQLGPRELVPVLSWVALKARCRHCATHISARYPVVELLTGALFLLVGWRIGWNPELPAYIALTALLVALSGIDFDTKTLPRQLIYLAGGLGITGLVPAAFLRDEPQRLWWAAVGALGALAAFWLLYEIAKGGFGFGDVRLACVLGLYLGWLGLPFVPVGLFLGFCYGSIIGVGLMIGGKAGRRTAVPFGPFMAMGALTVVLTGRPFVDRLWPI
jgi:leader peptidase (prepilin peptidase) / N-methyltransferase